MGFIVSKQDGANMMVALADGGAVEVLVTPGSGPGSFAPQAVVPILINNFQTRAPVNGPAALVFVDSRPFTLQPDVPTGGPTVLVTANMSVQDTTNENVIFSLVRDRGTAGQVILNVQVPTASLIGEGAGTMAVSMSFLDTVDTIDAITGAPSPLLTLSTHTYSIMAQAPVGTLQGVSGDSPADIVVQQLLGGHSVTTPTPPAAGVNLGTASQFASIGKAGIANTGTSAITGDLGVSPAAASTITGLALTLDGSGQFSTSAQVIGKVYASDYAVPTPAKMTLAVSDMMAAYTDAQGRVPTDTNLFGGHLGGQTLTPGVHKFTVNVEIGSAPAGNLTLNGPGVYIFQIAGTFDLASGTSIVLTGGALAQNVFFAVAGAVTLHAGSTFRGELLAATSIATQAGSTTLGRLLSQTGVTTISTTLTQT
jgi:hypothetical protein